MRTPLSNCNPPILWKDTLMSWEWEFMDKESIRERCKCVNKSTCLQIVDLLDNKKEVLAINLLEWMKTTKISER